MSPNSSQTQVKITGLTPQEAAARLDQFGPNEPTATRRHSLFSDFLHAFSNPLVLILVIAAVISAFMGEAVDAGIIGVIVLLSAIIDVTQTYRSQHAMERLRADPEARRRLGEAARSRAVAHHGLTAYVADLLGVYTSAIAGREVGSALP